MQNYTVCVRSAYYASSNVAIHITCYLNYYILYNRNKSSQIKGKLVCAHNIMGKKLFIRQLLNITIAKTNSVKQKYLYLSIKHIIICVHVCVCVCVCVRACVRACACVLILRRFDRPCFVCKCTFKKVHILVLKSLANHTLFTPLSDKSLSWIVSYNPAFKWIISQIESVIVYEWH